MDMIPPNNKHDAAIWLLSVLGEQRQDPLEPDGVVGVLPGQYGFDEVTAVLDRIPGHFLSGINRDRREIRFVPQDAFVYANLADMMSRRKAVLHSVPSKFSLQDIGYEHGTSAEVPSLVKWYFEAVRLWNAVHTIASYKLGGDQLHFVVSQNKDVSVSLSYEPQDLTALPSLQMFIDDVANADLHKQEKWAIARSGIVEQLGGNRNATFGDLIRGFENLMMYFRESYALFLAEFSTAKVRREVEKQNLDDALRLNKTLAEIQNQLLALPAAMLVVGATVDPENSAKTMAVLVGVTIFSVFMWLLIGNQKNSVAAIGSEISLRKGLLKAQPRAVAEQYTEAFGVLEGRVSTQKRVLQLVQYIVGVVLLLTIYMAIDAMSGGSVSEFWRDLAAGRLS